MGPEKSACNSGLFSITQKFLNELTAASVALVFYNTKDEMT